MALTLGSLFDGSGTCPLAATLCGIEPVWASEIEPYPVNVTKKNFPCMKHLGDITKINGTEIEPVDIITFGSPCQDLSVAGARRGLIDGERSNLFFEAIRVIREMREKTNGEYPKYAVWENVPGAFSSNAGRDFLEVLRAFAKVAGVESDVPEPPHKQGKIKWSNAGSIMADHFSAAWRMLDAQYWGVPQRRRRIYLVADFTGRCAGEILFKREGLRGNYPTGGEAWEGTATDATGSADGSYKRVYTLQGNGIDRADTAGCNGRGWREDICYTLNTIDRPAVVYDARGNGDGAKCPTLTGDHQNRVTDYTALCVLLGGKPPRKYTVRRLTPLECCRLQGFPDWWEDGVAGSDSARYKMRGNGMSLPCVLYVMEGLADALSVSKIKREES